MVPEKLRDLDAQRYDIIRKTVAAQDESEKHLTKEQVVTLVEWKLYVVPLNRDNICGFGTNGETGSTARFVQPY